MLSGRSVRIAVKYRSWNPTQQEWKLAAQCVQVEEKERIGKFVFKRDAKSAMVGRLVMRYAMSRILNVPSRTLQFSRTDKGKPFLLSPIDRTTPRCDVSFNISHHGDYVVFVAECGRLVGVDTMKIEWQRNKPIKDFLTTMEDQLTSVEWKQVKQFTSDLEQLKTFLRFWDKNFDKNEEAPSFRLLDIQDILSACEPLTGSSPDQEYWELFSSREEEPGLR